MGEKFLTISRSDGFGGRIARPPSTALLSRKILYLVSGMVVAAIFIPLAYLLIRVIGAGPAALDLIFQTSTLETLGRTVGLAVAVTVASALIAVPMAWLTTRTDLPLRRMWLVLSPLPMVIPSYVGAYLLAASLGPQGIIANWLESLLGIQKLPSIYGFPGALYIITLLNYPFIFLSARAALEGMDTSLEDAARSLGLSRWKVFLRVTLPQLRPAIASGGLLVALYVLRDFGAVSIMRYNTFTRVIYVQYKSLFDRSTAAAFALVLVGLTLLILTIEMRTRGRARYSSSPSRGPSLKRVKLGAWRWPALFFSFTISLLALFAPLGVLLYWLGRGITAGEQILPLWTATWNSLTSSGMAAGITVLAALPLAILSVRGSSRLGQVFERLSYSAFALPGIVVALALVFFGANYATPLYGSMALLLLAYGILFLPQAVGLVRSSLLQVHPAYEEAARTLGKSPIQTFSRVTFPLVRPGVTAGAALVFLTVMKELPATLILSPLGFRTLAVGVWSAVSEAFFAQAAAPALMLVLVSSLPMAILVLKEQR